MNFGPARQCGAVFVANQYVPNRRVNKGIDRALSVEIGLTDKISRENVAK
jgi:hypothetical protein